MTQISSSDKPLTRKLIAVCGPGASANPDSALLALAFETGQELARAGWGLVCGGLGGVMEAACRGAVAVGGLTVGILPGTGTSEANPFVQIAICTGIGEARNLTVVASGQAVIAVGGEFGTLSEIALARKLGRPVVLLAGRGWHLQHLENPLLLERDFKIAATAVEAVGQAVSLIG